MNYKSKLLLNIQHLKLGVDAILRLLPVIWEKNVYPSQICEEESTIK